MRAKIAMPTTPCESSGVHTVTARRSHRPGAWLFCLLVFTSMQALAACPAIGAIRWDAWFGAKGVPGIAVERSLGPARWHDRLPVCSEIVAPDAVRIACESPDQMAREIDLAAAAGLSFWAFVTYPDDDPMSLGLKTYLRAANRNKLGFALITELSRWGDSRNYPAAADRFVRLMSERGYLTTAGGRPVLFLGFVSDQIMNDRFGGLPGLRRALTDFRQRSRAAGLADPYIVLLEGDIARAGKLVRGLALDAVSAYALSDGSVKRGSYAQLTRLTGKYWALAKAANLELVPPAMTGWDRRPRVLNPVPWERKPYSEEQLDRYFEPPTSAELTDHLVAASLAARTPDGAAGMVLVYAWNEFDEGGWLAPTRGDKDGRLDAVRRAASVACPTR